jgi:transcriptional regulator with XRE-family HTH domain
VPLDAEKLRKLRQAKGWTGDELAKRARLTSRTHVSDIECGRKTEIRISTLEQLARALGVEPGELLKE